MLNDSYYAQNYAGIIGLGLIASYLVCACVFVCVCVCMCVCVYCVSIIVMISGSMSLSIAMYKHKMHSAGNGVIQLNSCTVSILLIQ